MKVLGIETSCDETAVCVIEASGDFVSDFKYQILGNALISQAALHAEFGGVFPNLAKREHARNLVPLLLEALQQAQMLEDAETATLPDLSVMLARERDLLEQLVPFLKRYKRPEIDCIAVTHGPGLEPALWVGINFARALSTIWNIPIVAVNHMEGHIVMPLVETDSPDTYSQILKNLRITGSMRAFEFPLLALLVSGGHTELVLAKDFGIYERLGETRDDAAGEAFDKIARLLGLPYPGGPEIARLAAATRAQSLPAVVRQCDEVTPHRISLPRPMMKDDSYDFSFSGLKTAVRKIVEADAPLSEENKARIAREVEDAICDVLVHKTLRAAEEHGAQAVVLGGGVSANFRLRELLGAALRTIDVQLLTCPPNFSTDNAIMIALAGYFHAARGEFGDPATIKAQGNLLL